MTKFLRIFFVYILLTFCFSQLTREVSANTKMSPEKGYEVYYKYNDAKTSTKTILNKLSLVQKQLAKTKDPNKKAELLFASAKYKIYLGYVYKQTNYVNKHSIDYNYSEPGDIYTYKGNDLKIITDKYTKAPIADEAGYLLATLPTPGECEGDVSCTIARELFGFEQFFNKFPNSPYIYNAILDMNDSFSFFIDDKEYSFYDDVQKNSFITSLNTYLKILLNAKNNAAALGLLQTAKAYIKVDSKEKAKEALHSIITKYPKFSKINETKTLLDSLK